MISKYLVQYIPASPEKKKAAETRVTGLRVLTSAEGKVILQEKDEKKKKEKERKKQERLNKKKEKDDLAKKKAEEIAKKVADKGKPMLTKRSRRNVHHQVSLINWRMMQEVRHQWLEALWLGNPDQHKVLHYSPEKWC